MWQAKPLETLNNADAKGPKYEGLLTETWKRHMKWQKKKQNNGNNGGLKGNQDNKQEACSSSHPHLRIIDHLAHKHHTNDSCQRLQPP